MEAEHLYRIIYSITMNKGMICKIYRYEYAMLELYYTVVYLSI